MSIETAMVTIIIRRRSAFLSSGLMVSLSIINPIDPATARVRIIEVIKESFRPSKNNHIMRPPMTTNSP